MSSTLIQSRVVRVLEDSRVLRGRVHVGGGGQTLLRAGVGGGLGEYIWGGITTVRWREIIVRDLTVKYFKIIEVQSHIINPKHGVVLTHPSLKVHVHVDQAGVL